MRTFNSYKEISEQYDKVMSYHNEDANISLNNYNITNFDNNVEIKYYRELYSSSGKFKKIIVFMKRVIRKLNKFLIEPITSDVTQCNLNFKSKIQELISFNMSLQNQINNDKERINSLELKIEELYKEIDGLRK